MTDAVGSQVFRRHLAALFALTAVLGLSPDSAARSQPVRARPGALIREIQQGVVAVRLELREARDKNDPVRARCVSAKLSETHAQLRLATRYVSALGVTSDPRMTRRHQYLVAVAHERAEELTRAARRCARAEDSTVRSVRR